MYSDKLTGMLAMNFVSFDVEIEGPEHIRTVGQSYMNTVERAMSTFHMGIQSAFQLTFYPLDTLEK